MRRLAGSALLGIGILLTGCGAATARDTSPAVISPTTVASTTPQAASFASIILGLQKLLRSGALPHAAAVPDAVVSCPTVPLKAGNYFACSITSQTIGGALFLGQITNATAGAFQEIDIGSQLSCSAFNSGEVLAVTAIGGCAASTPSAPTAEINGQKVVKPAVIGFSGDSGNVPEDLVWTGWGSGTANALGRVGLNNCTPDCAEGRILYVPVTVSVTDLYNNAYHSITEQIQGQQPATSPLPYP